MALATYNKFQPFVQNLANQLINLGSDTLKVMLSNTLPLATYGVKASIAEISAGNGYTAGGAAVTITSSLQVGGTYILLPTPSTSAIFTATGTLGPFRYAVLYDSTPAAGYLISWYDYGAPITLASGGSFIVAFQTVSGILQMT
jgi:hypothetical protein